MLRRKKSAQETASDLVDSSTLKADRLEAEMRAIKDDLDNIRNELGERIEEVREAIDEALKEGAR